MLLSRTANTQERIINLGLNLVSHGLSKVSEDDLNKKGQMLSLFSSRNEKYTGDIGHQATLQHSQRPPQHCKTMVSLSGIRKGLQRWSDKTKTEIWRDIARHLGEEYF